MNKSKWRWILVNVGNSTAARSYSESSILSTLRIAVVWHWTTRHSTIADWEFSVSPTTKMICIASKLGFITGLAASLQYTNRIQHYLPVLCSTTISCQILNCKATFDTVFAYDNHYNAQHRYRCSCCQKQLPSAHLLDLHLMEKHDSYFAVQAERKPMVTLDIEWLSDAVHSTTIANGIHLFLCFSTHAIWRNVHTRAVHRRSVTITA